MFVKLKDISYFKICFIIIKYIIVLKSYWILLRGVDIVKKIIPFAHDLLKETVQTGDIVVDATLGNGNDSLFLSELVGDKGKVYSFDIQKEAIENSMMLFKDNHVHNVHCILSGHEHAKNELLNRGIKEIDGVIFNLGYLPGSNQEVTTHGETTLKAINDLFEILKKDKYIVLVVYPGHKEGELEKQYLLQELNKFPAKQADIFIYQMINRSEKAPFVIGIYKK